jgi:hypothetical protein
MFFLFGAKIFIHSSEKKIRSSKKRSHDSRYIRKWQEDFFVEKNTCASYFYPLSNYQGWPIKNETENPPRNPIFTNP